MKNFISTALIGTYFFSLQLCAAERTQLLKSDELAISEHRYETVNWRKLLLYASKIKQHASDINGTAQILARYHGDIPSRYIGCSATGKVAIVRCFHDSPSVDDLSSDCMRVYRAHQGSRKEVKISPDGTSACYYHYSNADTVTLYTSDRGRQQLTNLKNNVTDYVSDCYFSFDNRYLAVELGSYAKLFERDDAGVYRECSLVPDYGYGIRKLIFTPHRIITSRYRGSINFYHYDGREAEEDLSVCSDHHHYIGDIECSTSGDLLAAVVTTYTDSRTSDCTSVVKMFDMCTRRCLYEINNLPGAVFVKFSPRYPILALYSNQFNGVKVYNIRDGKLLADLATPGAVCAIQFSPDGDYLYASSHEIARGGSAIIQWNLATTS